MFKEENTGGMLVNKIYYDDGCESLVCTLKIMEEKQLCLVSFNDARNGKKEYNNIAIYRMIKEGMTDSRMEEIIKANYDMIKNDTESDFYDISDKAINSIVRSLCE